LHVSRRLSDLVESYVDPDVREEAVAFTVGAVLDDGLEAMLAA